jgi:biotin transport system permease protein
MSDLVSTVETILSPLTRLGIRPDRVGIAVSLTLRFIPVLIEQGSRIREAQAARRVKAPLTFLVPLIIRTLRMADGVGEALEVRSSLGDSCGRRNIPDTMNPLNAVQVSPKGAP